MAELDIGGGDGGGGGIPTKYLIIGGGVLLVGGLLLYSKSGGSSSGGATGAQSATLGPNASIALGSLQTDLRTQFGDLEQLFTRRADELNGAVGGISAQLGTGFAGLQAGQSQIYAQNWEQYGNIMHGIWQTFMRASDPTWMPGGPNDPWSANENQALQTPATA